MAKIALPGQRGWAGWATAAAALLLLPIVIYCSGGAKNQAQELGSRLTRASLSIMSSAAAATTAAAPGECRCEDVCGTANNGTAQLAADTASGTGAADAAAQAAEAAAHDPGGSSGGSAGSSSSSGSSGGSIGGSGGGPAPPPDDWQRNPHVNQTAVAAYQPSLTWKEMDRAIFSLGDASRLRRVAAKLLAGKPVSVAFLGGSLTVGFAADRIGQTNFAARFLTWIKETFPGAEHRLVNGGLGGTGTSYYTMCVSRHVAPDVDLVFLETNVNDGPRPMVHSARKAHERLIRKLLRYPNRPAVVEILFWPYPAPSWEDNYMKDNVYLINGDGPLTTLAQYYYLPVVSARSLLWPGLKETRADQGSKDPGKFNEFWHIYDEKDDCCPVGTMDRDHPGETGHHWFGDILIRLLARALEDVARHPLGPEDEEWVQAPLTVPLFKGNWESLRNDSCLMREELRPYVSSLEDGWAWANEGKDECCPKWGLVSRKPGSSAFLTVDTHVEGLEQGDEVTVGIGYLRSYENMGVMEVTCVAEAGGCTCAPLQLDGHFPQEHTTQLNFKPLIVSPSEKCKLKFTVLAETQSGGHKCNILAIVFSEAAGYLITDDEETIIAPLASVAPP
ncbi:hypothetical protein ABPG75_011899 [Micractinium tetrahymenae]